MQNKKKWSYRDFFLVFDVKEGGEISRGKMLCDRLKHGTLCFCVFHFFFRSNMWRLHTQAKKVYKVKGYIWGLWGPHNDYF